MTTMIESDLRKLMQARAEQMPVDAPLIVKARARSHRIAVRQRIVVAAAAAFVAVAAVPTTVQVLRQDRPVVPVVPVGPAAASGDLLVNGPDLTPTFPMTPSYLPAGVKRQPTMGHEPGIFSASYEAEQGERDGPVLGVMLSVTTNPTTQLPVEPVPVTVQGRPASFRQEEVDSASVTWLHKPGQWVNVRGGNDGVHNWGTRAEILRIAEGLRDEEMSGQPAFTVALAPADFVLVASGDTQITLGPRAGRPDAQTDPRAISIGARHVSAGADRDGKSVTIGKRTGWLAERQGRYTLVLKLSATTRLQIDTPATGSWTEDTLAKFAAGVSFTGSTAELNG